jgi:capsular exopolysaccharide synthesis family protein
VEVIEAATIPDKPAGPNKIGMILLFCFFGLACGGGAAFFVDYMDNAVKIPEDIKNYAGLDVLGFVPVMDSPPGKEDEFRYHGLISALEPASSASEAYRQIRTKLFFSTTIQNCKTIVITSAGAGEGKTTTATNLACVMAQGGKRVLLLDADSRRPSLHRIVKCSSRPGLTSILMGQNQLDECTQPFKVDGDILEGVVIVPCGPIPPNPADVLGSDSMGRLLREAAEKYDRVLIDSPPVLVAADTSIICAHADGVIVVSRADETERSALRHCAEELTGVNAKLLGGVLNRVKVSRLNYYHSDYCYSGYSGYSEDYNNLSDSGLEEGI